MYEPEWWLQKLTKAQRARLPRLQKLDAYYRGDHPLEFATEQFRMAFGGLFSEFSDNWCETVVNATEERLNVVGFRFGTSPEADDDAWRIWQANQLDSESMIAHTEALVFSECYALVWPTDDPRTPRVTIEHPLQMICAHKAGNRRDVAAALKWYVDDDDYEVAYLYLPEGVYRFRSQTRSKSGMRDWTTTRWVQEDRPADETGDDADDPYFRPNPLEGTVPIVPLLNRPRLVGPPRSELETVVPLQDLINKLFADMTVASEYTADAQRWILGYEWEVDPDTNQPKPPPWNRKDRLWFVPQTDKDDHGVQIGQFSAGDLKNYIQAIEMCVNHIASQTRTPPHYLSPSADRLSGESIKASESGLVSKVRRKMVPFGESWEQTMRLCFRLIDDPRADFVAAETVWGDPEIRSEAEQADSALKRQSLGVPARQLYQDLGYTPTQVDQFASMRAEEALLDSAASDAEVARGAAEVLQKVYLGVTAGLITADEARDIANRAGAQLAGAAPTP